MGRTLEIVSQFAKEGATIYEITERLNGAEFLGIFGTGFKSGFTCHQVVGILNKLQRRGLVRREGNGNHYGIWRINNGTRTLINEHLRVRRGRAKLWGSAGLRWGWAYDDTARRGAYRT